MTNETVKVEAEQKLICPDCESANLKEEIIVDNFEYGIGPDALKLTASIPIITCKDCGCSMKDFRAHEIQHVMVTNAMIKVL